MEAPAKTVLLLGLPQEPWELEEAFPHSRVLVAAKGDGPQRERLLTQLWERSTRLVAMVIRDHLPLPEMAAFLEPGATVLVSTSLARGDEWDDFLGTPWVRERKVDLRLMEPGIPLASLLPSW